MIKLQNPKRDSKQGPPIQEQNKETNTLNIQQALTYSLSNAQHLWVIRISSI